MFLFVTQNPYQVFSLYLSWDWNRHAYPVGHTHIHLWYSPIEKNLIFQVKVSSNTRETKVAFVETRQQLSLFSNINHRIQARMSHLRVVIVQGSWRTSVRSRVTEEVLHHISKVTHLLYLNDKITEIQGLGKQEQPSSWNLSSHPWLPRQKMPPNRCQAQMYTRLGKEI